jgi:hypothetical protein
MLASQKILNTKISLKRNAQIKQRKKSYFTMRGGSLKKIAKKIIPSVPTNKKCIN